MVLVTELAIFRRERFLDDALSYNPHEPANALIADEMTTTALRGHPYIAHCILWHNQVVGNLARSTICAVLINLVLSSVLVLGFFYAGAASVVGLVTNTMLLGGKLVQAWGVCLDSVHGFQAVSVYKAIRVTFNVVDSNYVVSPGCRRPAPSDGSMYKAEFERARAAEKGDPRALRMQARGVITHMVVGDRLLKRWRRRANGAQPAAPAGAASAQHMV